MTVGELEQESIHTTLPGILRFMHSDELIYIRSLYTYWVLHYCCLFSICATRKMHDFQGYFSRNFQDQSDFPGLSRSWNFQ